MNEEMMQKSMFMAMLNYQQMLASAAAGQPNVNNSGGSATSNGSNSGAASPPGSINSANSPTPEQTSVNGVVSSPLLNLPKFCQDLLQQQQQNGTDASNALASFLPNGTDPTQLPNPLAALFRASANSTPSIQPTQEQVINLKIAILGV